MTAEFNDKFLESWQDNGGGFDKSIFHPIDSKDPHHHLLDSIPIPIHITYHKIMSKYCESIISVGIGCGTVDSKLSQYWNHPYYLVDPNINQSKIWSRKGDNNRVLQPDYAYVKDVITAHPTIVGNCGVSIIYPHPSAGPYDVEAIQLLNPRIVIILYELSESSGSPELFEWLGTQQDYVEHGSYESLDLLNRYLYGITAVNSLTILIRKDIQINETVPSGVHYTEITYQESKMLSDSISNFCGKRTTAS